MKRPKLRIIGVEEEELQLKGTKNIFNNIIEGNFSNLKKDIPMMFKKLTEHQIDWIKRITSPSPIIIKTKNIRIMKEY